MTNVNPVTGPSPVFNNSFSNDIAQFELRMNQLLNEIQELEQIEGPISPTELRKRSDLLGAILATIMGGDSKGPGLLDTMQTIENVAKTVPGSLEARLVQDPQYNWSGFKSDLNNQIGGNPSLAEAALYDSQSPGYYSLSNFFATVIDQKPQSFLLQFAQDAQEVSSI